MHEEEVPLGDSPAVRVGDTVRRPCEPWTPGVHGVLHHLEKVGFEGAPRVLDIDEQGREVLTYLPSESTWPYTEKALIGTARLLRTLHDSLDGFTAPAGAVWALPDSCGPGYRFGHNDVGPPNTVYVDGVPYAFIDWELAGPAPGLNDVICAAVNLAPLRPDHFCRAVGFSELPDRSARLRLFCDAYGLTDRSGVVEPVGAGVLPFSRYLAKGEDRHLRWDLDWVLAHRSELERALERPDGQTAPAPPMSTTE